MVRKKSEQIAEEPTNEIKEEPVVEDCESEEDGTIQKPPPKKKRVQSAAQKANFAKLQAANKIRYEATKIANEEAGIKPPPKPPNKNKEILENKEEFIKKEIIKKKETVAKKNKPAPVIEEEEEEEEEPVVVKKKVKKKTKPRIIIEDDSTDSEQEIVISRRRKNKKVLPKSAPIDIPNDTPKNEATHDLIEKEKKVEEKKVEPTLKDYSHLQILKGLGL